VAILDQEPMMPALVKGEIYMIEAELRSNLHSLKVHPTRRPFTIAVFLIGALLDAAHAVVTPCAALLQPRTAEGALKTEMLWVEALEKKDGNALACILAPSFVDTTWQNQLRSRAEILASLPQRAPATIHLSKMTVEFSGNRAVVRGISALVHSDGGLIGQVDFVDMFNYRDGRWQAMNAQETLKR
jgi:hypothetical protein